MATEPEAIRVVVDGEEFDVRRNTDAVGWSFDWVSGPNAGYGFATGEPIVFLVNEGPPPTAVMDEQAMRASIRSFLAEVDPQTGYIE